MTASSAVFPLKATDRLLFGPFSHDEFVVIAAELGCPGRNLSLTQLVEATGLKRNTVEAITKKLEEHPGYPTASFDRPAGNSERNPHNPQFVRPTRLKAVRADIDPAAPGRWMVELPVTILNRINRGKGVSNAGLLRRVACACAREQLIGGAVQVTDDTLAKKFGCDRQAVARARRSLIKHGILVPVKGQPNVWTMPGATPGKPEDPERLDVTRTKKVYAVAIGENRYDVEATASEHDLISDLVIAVGEKAATDAVAGQVNIRAAGEGVNTASALLGLLEIAWWEHEHGRPYQPTEKEHTAARAYVVVWDEFTKTVDAGRPDWGLREALKLAFTEHQKARTAAGFNYPVRPQRSLKGGLKCSQKILSRCSEDTGLLLLLEDPYKPSSSSTPNLGDRSVSPVSEDGFDERAGGPQRPDAPLREYGPRWFNVKTRADDTLHAKLLRFRDALEARYGHGDAAEIWRTAILGSRLSGLRALAHLKKHYADLDPDAREDTGFLDALLGGENAA